MKKIFVTGTDTDVGKTWVSDRILRHLVSAGHRVGAYKPVCSGAITGEDGQLMWSDVSILAAAIGSEEIERVCPQRFTAAVAPNVAAAMEGRAVDDLRLTAAVSEWDELADLLLIEGAGGLLCPLSDRSLVVDLAAALESPLVIVAANRLGVLNHTMLTVEVARSRGLTVAAVILNNVQSDSDDESLSSNLQQLRHWLPETQILATGHAATSLPADVDPAAWFA
ncbi:MAG: dethiobiotin synthase [Planctomycetaceae bacterium]|nr:dethiobiotin synthase [Planctomycetaceae bacterium]